MRPDPVLGREEGCCWLLSQPYDTTTCYSLINCYSSRAQHGPSSVALGSLLSPLISSSVIILLLREQHGILEHAEMLPVERTDSGRRKITNSKSLAGFPQVGQRNKALRVIRDGQVTLFPRQARWWLDKVLVSGPTQILIRYDPWL